MHGRIEAGEIKRRRGNNLRKLKNATRKVWRRGSESNRRVKVLQTSPLPLGYRAPTPYVSVLEEKSPSAEEQPGHKKIWSGRRGSNPRHRPWQGRALPLSYSRPAKVIINDGFGAGNGYWWACVWWNNAHCMGNATTAEAPVSFLRLDAALKRRSSTFLLPRSYSHVLTSTFLVGGPLGVFFGFYDVAVAHVDDAVSELGGFGIVGDHEDRLS